MKHSAPTYTGLSPASATASRIARASSNKRDTKPELLLRRALWKKGLRYRVDVASMPGRPDVVFPSARLAVFCDGDFWHGRDFQRRVAKLARGHNASYWVLKIKSNAARDRRLGRLLTGKGWQVLRFWESDIRADPTVAAEIIRKAAQARIKKLGKRASPRREPRSRSEP